MRNTRDSFDGNRTAVQSVRAFAILIGLALSACSSIEASSIIGPYVPPSAPSPAATREGARKAVAEEKLTGLIEISEVRESDHGPGRFIVCLRGAEQASSPRRTYAVFFDDAIYKGVRLSVMVDDCEKRDFRPF